MNPRQRALQRSHIKLVSYPHKVDSEYHDEYIPRKGESATLDATTEALNLRKSHFTVNTNPNQATGLSEQQDEYVPRPVARSDASTNLHHMADNIPKGDINEPTVSDSVYTADYHPYPIDPRLQPPTMGLQKSHFSINPETTSLPLDKSIHQTDYVPRQADTFAQALDTKTLQASHLPIYNDSFKDKLTETQDRYRTYLNKGNAADLLSQPFNPLLQRSSVLLGCDGPKAGTSETHDMLAESSALSGDKCSNMDPTLLRQSHLPFSMNADSLVKLSEAQENYVDYPGHETVKGWTPEYADTKKHVVNPDDARDDRMLSESMKNYHPFSCAEQSDVRPEQSKLKDTIQKSTNPVVIGDHNRQFAQESEFMNKYNRLPDIGLRSTLSVEQMKDLRRSHLPTAGVTDHMDLDTTTGAMMKESASISGKILTVPADMSLRKSHIISGDVHASMGRSTEYSDSFRKFTGATWAGTLDSQSLRKTHFTVAGGTDGCFDENTTYNTDYVPKPLYGNVWIGDDNDIENAYL